MFPDNNYCGLTAYPAQFNFADWWDFLLISVLALAHLFISPRDNWAKTVSINKNVKIYIGAPASSTAAGSGYVDVTTLGNIATTTRSNFSSFGGVMLWDASQAYGMRSSAFSLTGMLTEART